MPCFGYCGIIIVGGGAKFLAFVGKPFFMNLYPHERTYKQLFHIYQNYPDYTNNKITSQPTRNF